MKQDELRITPLAVFAIVGTALFATVFAVEQVYNYDLWWHLKSGVLTLSEGCVPKLDTLSFSSYGTEWVNTAWLSGVVLALLHQLGGIDLLIILKALIVGLSFGAGTYFLVRKGVHPLLAIGLLGFAVVVARFRFLLRPQVLIFPGAIALFWFLVEFRGKNRRLLVIAIVAMVFWGNLHGSAFLAPVFCAFLVVEVLIAKGGIRLPFAGWQGPALKDALALLALVSVALLVTPYGIEVPRLVFERFVVDDILENRVIVEEHLPLAWGTRKLFWALMIATGASFVAAIRKTRPFYLMIYIGTSILALSSVRYVGFAAMLQAVLLALNIQVLLQVIRWQKVLSGRVGSIVGVVILLGLGLFAFLGSFSSDKIYKWGLGVNQSRFPAAAVDFLSTVGVDGNLFNTWEIGGYLLWSLPEVKTSMDGRVLPAQKSAYDAYFSMSMSQFSRYLQDNDVKGALLLKSDVVFVERFNGLPNYNLQYFDDAYLVYLRNDIALPAGVGKTPQFRYIQPQSYGYTYLVPLARGSQAKEVEVEFQQALATSPRNFTLLFQYGFFLEALNRPEALDFYLQAAEVNPSLGFSHFKLGLRAGRIALKVEQWGQVIAILQQALEYGEGTFEHYFFLGTAYYKQKLYSESEKAYIKALEFDPAQTVVLQNVGFLMIDMRRFADAEVYFTKALKSAPGSEIPMYGLALTLDRLNRPEARQAWQTFMAKFPNSLWMENARRNLQKLEK